MTDGLRERKKLATRLALHRAALELVAERGLDAVSVEDVAARAEVSPRTFFNYFPSKVDAVVGLEPAMATELAEAFAARPSTESPVESLRAVQRARAVEMADESELWPLRMTVIDANPVLVQRLMAAFGESERALSDAIAARTGTRVGADAYPTLLAAVQGCAMRTALHRWLAGDFTASLPDLVDEAWDVLAAGLPAPRTTA
ncbi:TetR family transcriptional regulator [Blastococcus sp. SYSU DS0510]